MEAKELRIGNYVDTPNGIKRVSDISVDNKCYFLSDFVKPIPLTEEWLLKLGFEKSVSKHFVGLYINKIAIKLSFNTQTNQFWINSCNSYIKHIHQLQNLYFALTGEELTLKNKL